MKSRVIATPQGFRDVLFEDAARQRRIEQIFRDVLMAAGYREIIPSSIEFLELYERGHQHIRDRALKFLDRHDNLVALRADFTPAIARILASRPMPTDLPLKIFYAGSVVRRPDPTRGTPAESWQAGAELIGAGEGEADAAIIDLVLRAVEALGIRGTTIHLNHAGILGGLIEDMRLDERALVAVQGDIDRKDARGLAQRLRTLGVEERIQQQVQSVSQCTGDLEVLKSVASAVTAPRAAAALESLIRVFDQLPHWRDRITFDLTERDDLEYYTGLMFSIVHPGASHELGKGGRYDDLLPAFGLDLPAIGFSLWTDRLRALV
jgi:ATP phosphoribosyltransferase regulatory subunit